MAHCHKCGAVNCRLTRVSMSPAPGAQDWYICDSCRAEEAELNRKIYNFKKGIFVFIFTKVVPFALPLFIGMGSACSVKGSVNYVALIITFAVLAASFWVGMFVLGKKSTNQYAQMGCRFLRRIGFGAAVGFAMLACEMLGIIQPAAT